ncbi:MAG: hypothetical protein VX346_20300 [Planctomycetota bacterium]|nr:hypothetical protein [Planctomycetota bacterium]
MTNPLADCLWIGFIPSRQQVDYVHGLGKHIWLSLQINQKPPDIWDPARASQLDGICTDWPLECHLHWQSHK